MRSILSLKQPMHCGSVLPVWGTTEGGVIAAVEDGGGCSGVVAALFLFRVSIHATTPTMTINATIRFHITTHAKECLIGTVWFIFLSTRTEETPYKQ